MSYQKKHNDLKDQMHYIQNLLYIFKKRLKSPHIFHSKNVYSRAEKRFLNCIVRKKRYVISSITCCTYIKCNVYRLKFYPCHKRTIEIFKL